jgi:hypothetical protein
LTAENISPIDIHWQMKVVYGDNCVDISTVWCWMVNSTVLVVCDIWYVKQFT